MGEINLQIAVKEENSHLFKRCIRKLLESTFILRDKDERFYQFVSRESNRILDDKVGVCMLVASEEDADVVGLKRANVVTFTTLQYHLLLVLWKVYLENLGYSEGNYVTKGDLIDKIKSYQVIVTRTELNAAFRLFKKYSLIDFNDDEDGEDMKIRLYPSLQFGWDLPQFQTVADEYIKRETEEDKEFPDKAGEEPLYPEEFEEEGV